jgi:PBP1b-binding outer membrane lipoprotein LpoB
MKSLIAAALLAMTLAGCVAVPYYEPAPSYGYYSPAPYYYAPPAATFSFGYQYHRHRHRHRHRH